MALLPLIGIWDRLTHGASGDPSNLTTSLNLDYQKGFSPRDGLARVSAWGGIAVGADNLNTDVSLISFGVPIRSLIPYSSYRKNAPSIPFTD